METKILFVICCCLYFGQCFSVKPNGYSFPHQDSSLPVSQLTIDIEGEDFTQDLSVEIFRTPRNSREMPVLVAKPTPDSITSTCITITVLTSIFNGPGDLLAVAIGVTPFEEIQFLTIRSFANPVVKELFPNSLNHYSMRDVVHISGEGFNLGDRYSVLVKYSNPNQEEGFEAEAEITYLNNTMLKTITPSFQRPDFVGDNEYFTVQVILVVNSHPMVDTPLDLKMFSSKAVVVKHIVYGDVYDFTWAHTVQLARLENDSYYTRALSSEFIGHVDEYVDGMEKFDETMLQVDTWCSENVDIIFWSSYGYGPMVHESIKLESCIASQTQMAHFEAEPESDIPRISGMYLRIYEGRYIEGVMAGLMMKEKTLRRSHKACYIAAYHVPQCVTGANAFTLGCREANPLCVVEILYMMSWGTPIRERKAAQYMYDNVGCDYVFHHSTHTTSSQVFSEENAYAFGYPTDERVLVDESVLASVIINWAPLHRQVLAEAFTTNRNYPKEVWSGMKEGSIGLSVFSPHVPLDIQEKVNEKIAELESGEFEVFCAPFNIIDGDGYTEHPSGSNCLSNEEIRTMVFLVEGIDFPAPGEDTRGQVFQTVIDGQTLSKFVEHNEELIFKTHSQGVVDITQTCASLVLVCVIMLSIFFYHNRKTKVMVLSSHEFTQGILFFISVMIGGAFANIANAQDALICPLQTFMPVVGINGVLVFLFAKTYRVAKCMNNKTFNRVQLNVMRIASFMMLPPLLTFALWYAIDLPEYKVKVISQYDDTTVAVHSCTVNIFALYVIAIYILCIMVWGVIQAMRARSAPTLANESQQLFFTVVVFTGSIIMVAPLAYLMDENPDASTLLKGMGICFIAVLVIISLFAQKVFWLMNATRFTAKKHIVKNTSSQYRGAVVRQRFNGYKVSPAIINSRHPQSNDPSSYVMSRTVSMKEDEYTNELTKTRKDNGNSYPQSESPPSVESAPALSTGFYIESKKNKQKRYDRKRRRIVLDSIEGVPKVPPSGMSSTENSFDILFRKHQQKPHISSNGSINYHLQQQQYRQKLHHKTDSSSLQSNDINGNGRHIHNEEHPRFPEVKESSQRGFLKRDDSFKGLKQQRQEQQQLQLKQSDNEIESDDLTNEDKTLVLPQGFRIPDDLRPDQISTLLHQMMTQRMEASRTKVDISGVPTNPSQTNSSDAGEALMKRNIAQLSAIISSSDDDYFGSSDHSAETANANEDIQKSKVILPSSKALVCLKNHITVSGASTIQTPASTLTGTNH